MRARDIPGARKLRYFYEREFPGGLSAAQYDPRGK